MCLKNRVDSDKYFYVINIISKQKPIDLSLYISQKATVEVIALSPYSCFLLDRIAQEYKTYHSIVSEPFLKEQILQEYKLFADIVKKYKKYNFLLRNFASLQTLERYVHHLFTFLSKKQNLGYKVIYITDTNLATDILAQNFSFDKTYHIQNQDKLFYRCNKWKLAYSKFLYDSNILKKIYIRFFNKKGVFSYDNIHFISLYKHYKIEHRESIYESEIEQLLKELELFIAQRFPFLKQRYETLFAQFLFYLKRVDASSLESIHPFTFLSQYRDYQDILLYKKNKIPKIFMQHGSYYHENIFLKYNEIEPADINFVFNQYTKELFEKRGAKKVYEVGSINFNYKIKEKKKKYDFVYITYCTSYALGTGYIGNEDYILSIDGYNIYQRHKEVIELFAHTLKDYKICIKIQPSLMTGDMKYIPLLELAKGYNNIVIEYTQPLKKLIASSRYIISDYFSSEFINRELHYKRDILLFQRNPLSLPQETLEDMKKMFILVDDIADLEDKIKNINSITKDRKRDEKIIEYYSSKKCDTRNMVQEILAKELHARR